MFDRNRPEMIPRGHCTTEAYQTFRWEMCEKNRPAPWKNGTLKGPANYGANLDMDGGTRSRAPRCHRCDETLLAKVEVRIKAPLNTGTGQKSVSLTGSKLAREAPRHACRHLPRRRPKAAAGGGAGQCVLEPFRASFEPV